MQFSASTSTPRLQAPIIYAPELKEITLRLVRIFAQVPLTEQSFSDLRLILGQLEGQIIPLELSSICKVLKADFWQDWTEYSEAYSRRENLRIQYLKCRNNKSLSEAMIVRDLENEKVASLRTKLSEVEAEIARLQTQRFVLREELAIAQVRADGVVLKLAEGRRAQEEELHRFVESRFDTVRLEIRENIRSLVLRDVKHVLNYFEMYSQ